MTTPCPARSLGNPTPDATGPTPSPMPLGERLRRRRWDELRIFQAALAATIDLSPAQLCEIERGTARTTEPTLHRLAEALGLEFADLRAHAEREGQLGILRARPGTRKTPSARPVPGPPHPPRLRPDPPGPWLTTAEAAKVLGCSIHTVGYLIRRGRLAPARRLPKGADQQRRWLVAAEAVLAYDPPNTGRRWGRRTEPAPVGYLSVEAFAQQVGMPKATLYRRMAEGAVRSVMTGKRRWIPCEELATFRDREAERGQA